MTRNALAMTVPNKTKLNVFRLMLKTALLVFLLFFIFSPLRFADANNAVDFGAVSPEAEAEDNAAAFGATQAINIQGNVGVPGVKKEVKKGAWQSFKDNLKKFTWDKIKADLQKSGDIAYKQSLKYFLNTLAYDMATYLATGDKGQLPMFETEGWGGYLKNVADNTAGTFLETLGRENGIVKFNLCRPNLQVMLRINFGLMQTFRPPKPDCTITELVKNWDNFVRDKNFLNRFQGIFNPYSNDLGVALTLHTGIEDAISGSLNEATQARIEGKGWRPVRTLVDKRIKTPADLVGAAARKPIDDSTALEKVHTGTILADSVDIFINTLIGKLVERWLKSGLITDMPIFNNKLDTLSLTNPFAQNTSGGIADAQTRMRSIVEPSFKVRADYDILAELATCPDPNKAGPTECVIDEKFRQAIEKRLTVGEALAQGYLNANGVFGFSSDGLEPKFNEGYPYRSMLILRKYRIIPVGWEVAAQKIKDRQNLINGTKNLGDLVNCFSGSDNYGPKTLTAPAWCVNLVDPNWVLKAPQNFCKREGVGPLIISEQIMGEGNASTLAILRDDAYCADEQSCIKEKADGSCQQYGYCTEERRQWDFNSSSCEPRYNTCQTFTKGDGQSVSYLENTLDFSACNLNNAGCLGYCENYDYGSNKFSCAAGAKEGKVYLNSQAEECGAESEGCQELIRLNPGGGANLLVNSGFEEALSQGAWTFGNPDPTAYSGKLSLKMNGPIVKEVQIGGSDYDIAGESYALSFYAKDCDALADKFWLGQEFNSKNINAGADWSRNVLSYTYPGQPSGNKVKFTVNSGSCLIDNIKLERGDKTTEYSEYAAANRSLIHEKILPDYLKAACYSQTPDGKSFIPKADAPAKCADFARTCSKEEAGCELYASMETNTAVPAKVLAQDYCPAECVGYNSFIQSETYFSDSRDAYFIPKTAKSCSAEAAGCEQFTNLDEVAKGGEGIEYYSSLRQCVKKTGNEGKCGEFYTWEGSDESGYQLKVQSLELAGALPKETAGNPAKPCNEAVYNLPPSDPAYNPDCRQYYSRSGDISYHSYSKTITCTDDCHPYRLTALNIDDSVTLDNKDTKCSGSDKHWDSDSNQCVVCKNGGVWENNGCIYQAVPSQGAACSASQNACREYIGNTGNDIRLIFSDDFSSGTAGAWSGSVKASNESITLGPDRKGHSILVGESGAALAKRTVGTAVRQGKSYVLSFQAKASDATELTASFKSGLSLDYEPFSAKAKLGTNWQIYSINLVNLNHQVASGEFLEISAAKSFYITNIILKEIVDRFYLIKDSWRTPASCDQDLNKNPHPLYMLGCGQYEDRNNKVHNLKQFSRLCSESAVGCELMIDTHNSSEAEASYYENNQKNDGKTSRDCTGKTCLDVPADSFIYAVYDPDKLCGAEEKGCELLGRPYNYGSSVVYGETYLKNNPDKYSQILCGVNSENCQAFAYDGGEKYFKDPGDQVCEWRSAKDQGGAMDWFKKKVKKCDNNSNGIIDTAENKICLKPADCGALAIASCTKDADCGKGNTCLNKKCYNNCVLETADTDCPKSAEKTFGFGGPGSLVRQPAKNAEGNWAGLCPAEQSGCSEYIDPKSGFNANIVFNGGFQDLDNNDKTVDGWKLSDSNSALASYSQDITLESNTLYRLAKSGASDSSNSNVGINCGSGLTLKILENNRMYPVNLDEIDSRNNSRIIYVPQNEKKNSCTLTVRNMDAVEIKKVVVDYQLTQNIDKRTCNGQVDSSRGCVLFNERSMEGSSVAKLMYDADITEDPGAPKSNNVLYNDSNTIIKVTPDRTCDKWLACKSYIKDQKGDNVCFDIGLCDAVDENGNCQNFLATDKKNQQAENLDDKISNLTGYAKVGIGNGSLNADYYPLAVMKQAGEVANVSNGNFEYYGSNGYPIGWSWSGASSSWNENIFSVINNPIAAQKEGIGRAPEGRSFLKLGSSYSAESEAIDVTPSTDYIITAYVNTLNLKSGQARVEILNGTNASLGNYITQDLGKGWEFKIGKFRTPDNSGTGSRVTIKLYASLADGSAVKSSEGNFYFDDIKIRPALNTRINESVAPPSGWYAPQTCRLYPQTDSLACDYYEDSGKRQKGWPGYCLEYDRRPGDPNACLLWYPIDKVKGDGIEEGAGYSGKAPVYYCTEEVKPDPPTLSGKAGADGSYSVYVNGTVVASGQYNPVAFNNAALKWGDNVIAYYTSDGVSGGHLNAYVDAETETDIPDYFGTMNKKINTILSDNPGWKNSTSEPNGWTQVGFDDSSWAASTQYINNTINIGEDNSGGDGATGSGYARLKFKLEPLHFCGKIVQTVTQTGQNKYWNSRVYQGTNYKADCLDYSTGQPKVCSYVSDYKPFGSIVNPASSNPYDWDSIAKQPDNQPLFFQEPDTSLAEPYQIRAGQLYNKDNEALKKLFAKSYDAWQWVPGTAQITSGRYELVSEGWGPPGSDCDQAINSCSGTLNGRCKNRAGNYTDNRLEAENDYCAILPTITNIKVAGKVDNFVINNTGFINLTFNTKVDSNQLPLVMYGVDWGDDSQTIVSGVEMRDKPDPEPNNPKNDGNQEIIYHLYSYWDLKGKANSGVNSIDCSTPGQCKVKPKIQIKDNWGWCNKGSEINKCEDGQWDEFGDETADLNDGWIIVKEK